MRAKYKGFKTTETFSKPISLDYNRDLYIKYEGII